MDVGIKPNVFGVIEDFCSEWKIKTITLSKDVITWEQTGFVQAAV